MKGAGSLASKTKAELLARHHADRDLKAKALAPVMRDLHDLSADGLIRPLDERIIAATSEALESGQTHYVDVPGIAPLRQALADYLAGAAQAAYQQANIIVTAGMQEARFLSIQLIGESYASIAVPAVAHPGVRKALGTRARHIVPLAVEAGSGYLPSVQTIGNAAETGCQLLYLESPSRLSGAVYSADEVAAINQIAQRHELAVIWDQGLAPWVAGDYVSLAAHDQEAQGVACIGEAFPGMGLASWYIGYIAAPEAWIPPMQAQKQIMSICTSTASQYGALEASQHFDAARDGQLAAMRGLREPLVALANEAGMRVVNGAAANILALKAADGQAALAKLLAAGYAAADGADFGAPDVIRLNVTHDTAQALRALA